VEKDDRENRERAQAVDVVTKVHRASPKNFFFSAQATARCNGHRHCIAPAVRVIF